MLTRSQILDEIITECAICKQLHTKIPDDGFEFRPTAGQRSTLELLRYLSTCGIMGMRAMVEGHWGSAREYVQRSREMSAEEFPAAMDRQIDEMRSYFNALSDEQLASITEAFPDGTPMPVGQAIMKTTLKWLVAYKMQLFLYVKMLGAHELDTGDCWLVINHQDSDVAVS